jgi:hypothetical protein
MHVCSFVYVCFVNYLEQHTVLYQVDRHNDDQGSSRVECRLLLTANEHARKLQHHHHHKKRVNIVISDMDTTNTCDRPLMKFLWNNCCEWNCSSHLFRKFQVNEFNRMDQKLILYSLGNCRDIYFGCICGFIYYNMYYFKYIIYGTGSTWSK